MELIAPTSVLRGALSLAGKTISTKSALPILDCVLISRNGDGDYLLTASDVENTLSLRIPLTVEGDFFPVCLPLRTCSDMLSAMPEQPLTFDIDSESLNVTVHYLKGHFSFMAENPEAYPASLKMNDDALRTTLSADCLTDVCARELPFVANDDLRPVMNGIYFDMQPHSLTFAASDGHKLIRIRRPDEQNECSGGFILSSKASSLLRLLLDKVAKGEQLSVASDTRNIRFSAGDFTLECRQIEGRYPNYNAVFPSGNSIEVTIDRKALIGAIRRTVVMADKATGILRLKFNSFFKAVELFCQNIDFSTSAEETIEVEFGSDADLAIGFKADYLRTLLETATSDKIKMSLKSPATAMIMTEVDGDSDLSMLLMPMMLND